ncbi:MAG: protein tyrosine phosphatase [Hyphomicrobiaceae bacterium]|nr:protein tyrosine phosphatase [Hyphomicrobiaceae bacterium]
MPAIHVCSLARMPATVVETGASHIATLINRDTAVERPDSVAADNHLFLGFNDITTEIDGLIPPGRVHVERLLAFVRDWDRKAPMVVHCWAGVSRSTAGAFIAACALRPDLDEAFIAGEIRRRSPAATPNMRLVGFADEILERDGRMVAAIAGIGRGEDCYEGHPFTMRLDAAGL